MDEAWYNEIIGDMAAFVPDQTLEEILEQLIEAMVACDGRLTSADLGRLLAVAAAIKRQGEGTKGWWAR
ncbi:MAG: hypothetical protein ACXVH6_04460 [Halobacteriota archaeon]